MLLRIYTLAILVSASGVPVHSQTHNAASPKQTVKRTAPASKPLTVDEVLAMVQAGISDEVLIARLHKEDHPFDLTSDELIRLKKAKVSDAVLQVMMDPKMTPEEPARAREAVPSIPMPAPVIAGLGTSNRSGATPSPGVSGSGDVNDPLTPHDSGIYLYTKDREGKPQMIVLERAAYQGSKTGGMFASAMTYGIMKAKTKAVIPGPRAGVRVNDPSAVFYFYFDDKQAGLGKTYFGYGNLSSPNQFVLLRLEVNKSNRETIIGQYSALGAASGSDTHAMVPFKSERIRPGLYKVALDDIKAGEYCFLASSGMVGTGIAAAYGAYAPGVTSGTDLFDFGVSLQ